MTLRHLSVTSALVLLDYVPPKSVATDSNERSGRMQSALTLDSTASGWDRSLYAFLG
jgi:hypothetical protein